MEKKDYIEYWKSTAEKDWEAVGHLFEKGDYLHAAHLVLEKLLKAHHLKSFCLFFCLLSLPISLSAQSQPVQLWQAVEYVQSINVKGPTIALDKFQNTYMLTNQTDANFFGGFSLVKYDTLGNVLWNRNYPPGIIGHFYGSFTVDSLGYSYVGLRFDGGLPQYDADAIMLKYDPDGVKVWEASYGLGQAGDSYIYYSEMDTLHGRLITLGVNWNDTIPADNFLFVQAIDTSDGSVIWRTRIPGVFIPQNMRVQAEHIQLLSTKYKADGKYFVNSIINFNGEMMQQYENLYTGYEVDFNYISKTGDVVFGNRGFGYPVTRVDILGDTLWRYEYPNFEQQNNRVRGLIEDDSLNVYAVGSVEIQGLSAEMMTSKIDIDGELVWQDIFHSSEGAFVDGVGSVKLANGELIVCGNTQFQNTDIVGIIKTYNSFNGAEGFFINISNNNIFWIDDVISYNRNLYYVGEGFQTNLDSMTVSTGCFRYPIITSLNETHYDSMICAPNPSTTQVKISNIDIGIFKKG
jgi:hypothetical protein